MPNGIFILILYLREKTMILKKCIEIFIRHLQYERKLSEHTVLAYENDLRQFMVFLENESYLISEIESVQIRSWFASLKEDKISDRSIKRKASSIKIFFQYFLKIEIIKVNPAKLLLLNRSKNKLPDFLEQEQTAKLLTNNYTDDTFEGFTVRLIIELLYQTGMRRGELIQLKEADVNFSRKEILIFGKGKKERIVPVHTVLLEQIKEYIALKNKNFENPPKNLLSLKSGKKLYDNFVYRVVKTYLENVTTLNTKSPHLLRHTFATQLLNNGANLEAIKDLLGHSSLAATQVYTHLNIEKLKEVYKNTHPKSTL